MRKGIRLSIGVVIMLLAMTGCGEALEKGATGADTPIEVTDITVNTSVRKTGQYPENIVVTFDRDINKKEISASSFHMQGEAGYWGSDDTRSFEAEFESATISGNALTLVPSGFPEKYFYVKSFSVTCDEDEVLSFSSDKITKVNTPIADEFDTKTYDGDSSFEYHLFDPGEKEPVSVVIVFHGYGDTNNLLTYRTAVEWADPDNQKVRPCFVLAPVIDDQTYFSEKGRDGVFTGVHEIVDKLSADGKIDPDRVYVMGNSFGGMSSIEYAEKYPENVAGVLALCPALNYSTNAMRNLKKMIDVPIWFAHAKSDNTIPSSASETAVKALEKLGAKEVHFTEYSDEEMNLAGADPSPDATYSYHHVELAVMEDDAYMQWLFEKTL